MAMDLSSLFRRTITFAPSTSEAKAVPPNSTSLTIGDVVILDVPLSWHEAVAVLLEFLERVPAKGPLPDPARVALSPIGETRALGSATLSGSSVKRAAELLQQLIGRSTSPAALRELIAQDLGDRPAHATVGDLARALSYFERPNRRADVAAVYTRAYALFQKAAADRELDRLRVKATHDRRTESHANARRFSWLPSPRHVVNAVVVFLMCGVIAISSFALVRVAMTPAPPRPDAPPPEVATPLIGKAPAVLADIASDPSKVVEAASTQVKKLLDRGLAAAGVTPATTSEPGVEAAPKPTAPPTSRRRAPKETPGMSTSFAASPARSRSTGGGQWTVSVQEVTSPVGLAEFVSVATDETDEHAGPVYSRADPEVDPAVLVRPQMPSIPEDLAAELETSVFDLLIDQSGRVEQVKLVSPENRFNDRILVSAAKAWQFQPATRDGQPVRYQLRLRITP